MAKHQKHSKLSRPKIDQYSRSDWAILGTTCNNIQQIVHQLIDHLHDTYTISYLDGDHDHSGKIISLEQRGEKVFHRKSHFWHNRYDENIEALHTDMAFVNGNHFPASKQIVCIDSKKEASLKRRIDQLTDIKAIILMDKDEPFDFVKNLVKEKNVPVLSTYLSGLASIIDQHERTNIPPLKGLVLAGGKSMRMGEDKSQIRYYQGLSQEEYAMKNLEDLGIETYLSKRISENQSSHVLVDVFTGLGPFGAICSAFQNDPNAAWIVLACDLPFIDNDLLQLLIKNRDASQFATCIKGASKEFVEPLITIYEPKIYQRMLSFLALGYACPRKVLINSNVKTVEIKDEEKIYNVNTPEDYQYVMQKINGQQ